MSEESSDRLERKLDALIELTQHIVALELSKRGVGHAQIGKHLHIAKARVGKLLKGVEKERRVE